MAAAVVLLAVRTGLDILNNVIIHLRPREVPPYELDSLILSEMSYYLRVMLRLQNSVC